MADTTIEVRAVLIDEISSEVKAIRAQIESNFSRASAAVKKHGEEQGAYARKMGSQFKNLAFQFIGLGAAYKTIDYLTKGLKDAGLQTDGFNKSMTDVRATIASQLLPEVQGLMDYIAENAQTIAGIGSAVINGIMLPFRSVTAIILGNVALIAGAISKVQAMVPGGSTGKDMQAYAFALLDEQKKVWEQITAPKTALVNVKKKPTGKKTEEKEIPIFGPSIEGFYESEKAALEKQKELEKLYRDESVKMISDQFDREIAETIKLYEEKLSIVKEGSDLEKVLKYNQTQNIISIEKKRTEFELQESQKRIAISEFERKQKVEFAMNVAGSIMAISAAAIDATVKDAKKRQAILMALTMAEGIGASMVAFSEAWKSKGTGEFWSKLGIAIGTAASITAYTISQAALINRQKFAGGTRFAPGGSGFVGEQGPEYTVVPRGAQIVPARQSRALAQGGDVTVNITIPNATGDPQQIVTALEYAYREGRLRELTSRIRG